MTDVLASVYGRTPCKSDKEPPKQANISLALSRRIELLRCPSKKNLDVIERKTISSGLELSQTDNMPSPLCALHSLHITDSTQTQYPLHAIDGTRWERNNLL